jgi:hypothetical protein
VEQNPTVPLAVGHVVAKALGFSCAVVGDGEKAGGQMEVVGQVGADRPAAGEAS